MLMFTNPANFTLSEICSAFFGDTRNRPLGFNSFNNDAKNVISKLSVDFTTMKVNIESEYEAKNVYSIRIVFFLHS